MIDLIPDSKQLSEIFAQAIAPTFFLGAIAGFLSLMDSRLSAIMERVKNLNAIAEDDTARSHLKGDLERLRRRVHYLNSGIIVILVCDVLHRICVASFRAGGPYQSH